VTQNGICSVGTSWNRSSLIWGQPGGNGEQVEVISPADGSLLQRVSLLSSDEVTQLIAPTTPSVESALSEETLRTFTARLHAELSAMRPLLMEAMQMETAFLLEDCEELVQASLHYITQFWCQVESGEQPFKSPQCYRQGAQSRQISLTHSAWGTVAVILPQNAFLLLAVTCLLNALAAGNRVILRAPLQSARSAALLSRAIQMAQPPANTVSVILAQAKEFLASLYRSPLPCLVHYMGSSRHVPHIMADAFRHGKAALFDGEGNGWVWVGADACPETTAHLLTAGALRYNGQTCTSVNGALIHPALYSAVKKLLVTSWETLRAGSPFTEGVQVGPLFDAEQAAWCEQRLTESDGTVLCGQRREGNLLTPTLIECPSPQSSLVTEGIFGPAMWIAPAEAETFVGHWQANRYPLCAGILSPTADPLWWQTRLSNLSRLVLNGDISQEFLFEPWGGYPGSGMNPVGTWKDKYRRVLQVDIPL
jgi:acyl-CoA reductase-like NAD-dependent aldehyde dehydrogenase